MPVRESKVHDSELLPAKMNSSQPLRTIEEVLREFKETGVSISAWARANGFSVPLVYGVLSGRKKAARGQTHNIAITLGIKAGRIGRVEDLTFNSAGSATGLRKRRARGRGLARRAR